MLTITIPNLLDEGPDVEARSRARLMDELDLRAAVEKLVEEYHGEAAFGRYEEGRHRAALDASEVQEHFLYV